MTIRPRLRRSAGSAARDHGGGAEQVDLHDAVPFGAGHLRHPPAGVGARGGDDGVEPFRRRARGTASSAARVSARSTTTAGASARAGTASVRAGRPGPAAAVQPPAAATAAATARPRPDAAPVTSTRPTGRTVRVRPQRTDRCSGHRMVVMGVPPWSGGGERGVCPSASAVAGQRRLDGAAQHVHARRGGPPAPSRCRRAGRPRRRTAGPAGWRRARSAPTRPRRTGRGGLRGGEQVAAAAAGGHQDQHVAGPGVRPHLPGVHLLGTRSRCRSR